MSAEEMQVSCVDIYSEDNTDRYYGMFICDMPLTAEEVEDMILRREELYDVFRKGQYKTDMIDRILEKEFAEDYLNKAYEYIGRRL